MIDRYTGLVQPTVGIQRFFDQIFSALIEFRVCNTHISRVRTTFNARFFRMHPQKLFGCIQQVLGFSRGHPRSVGVLQIREILSGA